MSRHLIRFLAHSASLYSGLGSILALNFEVYGSSAMKIFRAYCSIFEQIFCFSFKKRTCFASGFGLAGDGGSSFFSFNNLTLSNSSRIDQ